MAKTVKTATINQTLARLEQESHAMITHLSAAMRQFARYAESNGSSTWITPAKQQCQKTLIQLITMRSIASELTIPFDPDLPKKEKPKVF